MNTGPSVLNKVLALLWVAALGSQLLGCGSSTFGSEACRSSADCMAQGSECNLKTGVCEEVCQQELCAARFECSSYFGACTPVNCGKTVACQQAGDFCDLDAHECYPTSGKCSKTDDCPLFDGRVSRARTLSCVDGFCQLASTPPLIITSAPQDRNAAAVRVTSPTLGVQVDTTDQLQFRWEGNPDAVAITLVLTDLPQDLSQVLNSAVWGRMLPVGAEPVTRWQDGVAIRDGLWLPSSAAVPIGPLYFLVQTVRAGKLVSISAPIPFRIGSAWPALYDRCSDDNVLPGSCAHPTRPQICWKGFCRLLCASHLACKADGSTLCGAPTNGVRICG